MKVKVQLQQLQNCQGCKEKCDMQQNLSAFAVAEDRSGDSLEKRAAA